MNKLLILIMLISISCSQQKSNELSEPVIKSEIDQKIDLEKLIEFGDVVTEISSSSTTVGSSNPVTITKNEQGLQTIVIKNSERRSSVSLDVDEGETIAGLTLENNCSQTLSRSQKCYIRILLDPTNIAEDTIIMKTIKINGEELSFQYTIEAAPALVLENNMFELRNADQSCGTLFAHENESCSVKVQVVNTSRIGIPVSVVEDSFPAGFSLTNYCPETLERRRSCYFELSLDSSLSNSSGELVGSVNVSGLHSSSLSANIQELTPEEIIDLENASNADKITIDSSSLNLGNIPFGQIKSKIMKVKNNSREEIALNLNTESLEGFAVSGCPSVLKRYQECYLNLVYNANTSSSGLKEESFSIVGVSHSLQAEVSGIALASGYIPTNNILFIASNEYTNIQEFDNNSHNIMTKLPSEGQSEEDFAPNYYISNLSNIAHTRVDLTSPLKYYKYSQFISDLTHILFSEVNGDCSIYGIRSGSPEVPTTSNILQKKLGTFKNGEIYTLSTKEECLQAARDIFQSNYVKEIVFNENLTLIQSSDTEPTIELREPEVGFFFNPSSGSLWAVDGIDGFVGVYHEGSLVVPWSVTSNTSLLGNDGWTYHRGNLEFSNPRNDQDWSYYRTKIVPVSEAP